MVRVPISQKAHEVGFQFLTRIVCKMVVDNALIPEFFGKFCLPFLQICRKRCKLRCVIYIYNPQTENTTRDLGSYRVELFLFTCISVH